MRHQQDLIWNTDSKGWRSLLIKLDQHTSHARWTTENGPANWERETTLSIGRRTLWKVTFTEPSFRSCAGGLDESQYPYATGASSALLAFFFRFRKLSCAL